MLRSLSFLVICFLPFLIFAQSTETIWDLNKCLAYAMENNINIKQADIQARIEQVQLRQTKNSLYPTGNISSMQVVQFGRTIDPNTNNFIDINILASRFQFSGAMPVVNFGGIKNLIRAEKKNAEAAILNTENTSNDVLLTITAYFMRAVLSKEQIKLYELDFKKTKLQIDLLKEAILLGATGSLNLYRLQTKNAIDSVNYIDATINYQNSIIALQALLNVDFANHFSIESPVLDNYDAQSIAELKTPELIYEVALKNNVKSKINILQTSSYQYKLKSTLGSRYPNLSFVYNASSLFANIIKDKPVKQWWEGYGAQMSTNFNQIIGFNLNIPIANNGVLKTTYSRDKLVIKGLLNEKNGIEVELKKNIYSASSLALGAYLKMNEVRKTVESSQAVFDMVFEHFKLGGIGSQELIMAQDDLLKAKQVLLSNIIDLYFKLKMIDFYKTGQIR